MSSLVEAIKKLREIQNSKKDLVIQNVVFDLSSQFIGQPMTQPILKNFSSYIDQKLVEFSRVHGTFPAIMRPSRDVIDSEDCTSFCRLPEKLSDISTTAINALKEAVDEHDHITQQKSKYVTFPIFDEESKEECESYDDDIIETQLSNIKQKPPNEFGSSEIIDTSADTLVSSKGYYDSTTGQSFETNHKIQRSKYEGINQIEEQVYSHGCFDTMTNRGKDVIIRVPQNDSDESKLLTGRRMIPHTNHYTKIKDISYITSYEIDRITQTIKTRIITAPNTAIISNDEWFDMIYGYMVVKDLNISNIIKTNLCIISKTRAEPIKFEDTNLSEQTALETLREIITEKEYRHYLCYGFLIVSGQSGKKYQVYRNKSHTKVWQNGKLLEEVCIRIKDTKIPLTDNVIAFKTMIEADENHFRKLGNVYKKEKVA